jgi:multidrug efflux pump subunit AcrB
MFNIAAKARPYFGAVVLTTALLTVGGIYSYTRMPSSVYPEVTFARIAVGIACQTLSGLHAAHETTEIPATGANCRTL